MMVMAGLLAPQLGAQDKGALPARITNSVGMTFILVKPGEVPVGWPNYEGYPDAKSCPADDPFTAQNERQTCIKARTPQWYFANRYGAPEPTAPSTERTLAIDYPYYLQETEVTQEQWFRVMKYNTPSQKGTDPKTAPLFPANGYTLTQLEKFVAALNELEGTDEYRLPSEMEWQYACQAGESEMASARGNQAKVEAIAWFKDNAGDRLHPAKQKAPNAWGFYDMIGNVSEYVLDVWQDWHYRATFSDDGSPFYPPRKRVPLGSNPVQLVGLMTRGTNFRSAPQYIYTARDVQTCSARQAADPDNFVVEVGLRVARSTVPGQAKLYARPFRADLR